MGGPGWTGVFRVMMFQWNPLGPGLISSSVAYIAVRQAADLCIPTVMQPQCVSWRQTHISGIDVPTAVKETVGAGRPVSTVHLEDLYSDSGKGKVSLPKAFQQYITVFLNCKNPKPHSLNQMFSGLNTFIESITFLAKP